MKNIEFTFDALFGAAYEIEFANSLDNVTYKAGVDGYHSEDGGFIAYSDIDTVVRNFVGFVFVYNADENMIVSIRGNKDKIRIEI